MDASDLVDGRKRAALALVGLNAADRKWLLAQLPQAERDDVLALLDELERMRLPASAEQIAAAADALTPEPLEPEPALPAGDPLRALARADAAAVHRELSDEPDAVIACVCALKNWRWNAELADLLGEARALNIGRLQREAVAPAPAVAQALIAALAARIEARSREGFAGELRAAQHTRMNGRHWWSWRR